MSGVPTVRVCSGNFRGSAAHAFISKMEHSAIRPCWENENNLKWGANYRYLPIFSTIPSLWIPTTLRYSPLFQVSGGVLAEIPYPPKFPEHSRPGGSPQPRHPVINDRSLSLGQVGDVPASPVSLCASYSRKAHVTKAQSAILRHSPEKRVEKGRAFELLDK